MNELHMSIENNESDKSNPPHEESNERSSVVDTVCTKDLTKNYDDVVKHVVDCYVDSLKD